MSNGHHRKTLTRVTQEQRRKVVAQMYLQGHVQYTIATITGVSSQTVSKDLDFIRKEWLENRLKSYDERMNKELSGLDYQESQLWESWHNSCKQEIVQTITRKKIRPVSSKLPKSKRGKKNSSDDHANDPSNELIIIEENDKTTTRQLYGDPRFMAEITKIRELRCKLLGLLEDEPLQQPIVNIWEQLQDIANVRDYDKVEERLLELEAGTPGQPLGRPIVKASELPDPIPEPSLEDLKKRTQEDAIKKHLNLDWLDDHKNDSSNGQPTTP